MIALIGGILTRKIGALLTPRWISESGWDEKKLFTTRRMLYKNFSCDYQQLMSILAVLVVLTDTIIENNREIYFQSIECLPRSIRFSFQSKCIITSSGSIHLSYFINVPKTSSPQYFKDLIPKMKIVVLKYIIVFWIYLSFNQSINYWSHSNIDKFALQL